MAYLIVEKLAKMILYIDMFIYNAITLSIPMLTQTIFESM
jgi:hypothetical protein